MYNATNIIAAITVGKYFEVALNDIKRGIESYTPENNRSQIIFKNGNEIILDAYNANPSSMDVALDNFIQLKKANKVIIIGDMFELGDESKKEHQAILELAQNSGFDEIITVGKIFRTVNHSQLSFEDTPALTEYLKANAISSKNVLLKGSRGIALEKAIEFI